jgi:hypothetical protein
LIGGEGVDRLAGAGDDDILIAGSTPYEDDPVALRALMAEWTRRDLAYADRVNHLQNGGGRNGQVRLDSGAVADDGKRDQLTSGPGLDWFFASAGDRISGRKAPEILTPEARPTVAIAWSAPAAASARRAFGSEGFTMAKPSIPEFAIEAEDIVLEVGAGPGGEQIA